MLNATPPFYLCGIKKRHGTSYLSFLAEWVWDLFSPFTTYLSIYLKMVLIPSYINSGFLLSASALNSSVLQFHFRIRQLVHQALLIQIYRPLFRTLLQFYGYCRHFPLMYCDIHKHIRFHLPCRQHFVFLLLCHKY